MISVQQSAFSNQRSSFSIQRARIGLILGLLVFASGCSSSKSAKDDETFYLGAFEDFDDAEHPDVIPPPLSANIGHEIPDGLEEPTEDHNPKTGSGYRVQLYASRDKAQADAELQRAINWWETNRGDEDRGPPIYVEYEQPYFKVRLGDYRRRSDAAAEADKLAATFRGAFVVPATINLR